MNIVEPADYVDVLRLATTLHTTFYDASYIHVATRAAQPLVTDDKKLAETINENKSKNRALPTPITTIEYINTKK
jgi:predicted nucleic acid-binding protein